MNKRFYFSIFFLILILLFIGLVPVFMDRPELVILQQRFCSITLATPLGCDHTGNNYLSVLAYGGRISLFVAFSAMSISTVIGVILGLASGYFGGFVDTVTSRVLDIFLAFPGILLAIFLSAILPASYFNIILAMSLTGWMGAARIIRAEALSLRYREHVSAATMYGASHLRIMTKHIFPLIVPLLIVQFTFSLSGAIIVESSLSFLGLSPQSEVLSWGGALSFGKNYLVEYPLLSIAPGFLITVVVLCLNFIGDDLRDYFDPYKKG